jgi:hypothetical protein
MWSQRQTECGATTHLGGIDEGNNDATLEELRYLLYGRIGFSVSRATIGRMIKLLGITVKKNSLLQVKAPLEFKSCDVSSGKQLKRGSSLLGMPTNN